MTTSSDTASVFVVHGRDEDLRRAMFSFLRSIGLQPMEWDDAIALTGEGSPYVGKILDVAFSHAQAIVVLLTPDEVAYLQPRLAGPGDPETQPAPQARPNVLFEAGMALGRDPDRTVLVEVGDVRPFSDVAGRHTIRMSNDVAKRQALATRLRTAGCAVNTNGTDWHTDGDFTQPPHPGARGGLGRRVPTAPSHRPPIDFDLRYVDKGGRKMGKLQIINRGTETAFEVNLTVPANAALELRASNPIPKIPGGGKSVAVDVHSRQYLGGGPRETAFDVEVSARTEDGESVTQQVFLDVNG